MKSKTYKFKAPAKINVGLHVLSKRKDGYHNIETIFYPIKIFDIITLKIGRYSGKNKISVKTIPPNLVHEKNNICYKAVEQFLNKFKIKENYYIKVKIKKNIPLGGGLGGGSSDAAAVLKGLHKHFKNIINDRDNSLILNGLALSLGSDVPFFLTCKPAYAARRGEKLKILNKFKIGEKTLLVNPGIHISTKWAYEKLNIKHRREKKISSLLNVFNNKSVIDFLIENELDLSNDFEKIVFKKYPEVKSIKDKLNKNNAIFSSMSGSGSSIYGIFEKIPRKLIRYFKSKGYFVYAS